MTAARYLVGDVFERLAELDDGSVDLILTSPPFLALRSYLPAGHPDKGREIGSEATPGAFIDRMLDLTEEWARVLAPHGSICIELGDTYAGSGGAGGDYNPGGLREGQPGDWKQGQHKFGDRVHKVDGWGPFADNFKRGGPGGKGWPLPKSLCLIPELYRMSLVYGFNPLTGRQTPRWRARNVVRWCRPNPPVGALGDKLRPATSEMVVACKGRKRYFDLDAVRVAFVGVNAERQSHGASHGSKTARGNSKHSGPAHDEWTPYGHPAGAPPLDHWWIDDFPQDAWLIPTQPYKGAHYATWPEQLCVIPIEAMCPRRVCVECGKPSERITEAAHDVKWQRRHRETEVARAQNMDRADRGAGGFLTMENRTLGWSDCGHNSWRTGLILDPFAGSGTTLAVAVGHGRDAIGIDLDGRTAELARERCGMFVTIEATPCCDAWAPTTTKTKTTTTDSGTTPTGGPA